LAGGRISLACIPSAFRLKGSVRIKGNPGWWACCLRRKRGGSCKILLRPAWVALALTLAGCTAAHYRRSADKEAYKLIGEKTLLVTNMEPHFTIEQATQINFTLPNTYETNDFLGEAALTEIGAGVLSLEKALEFAVKYGRAYQERKESLYLSALSLSLARHQYTPIFAAGDASTYTVTTTPRIVINSQNELVVLNDHFTETRLYQNTGFFGVDWLIRDIGRITAAFTTDFIRYVSGDPRAAVDSQLAATFTRPLLRDSGFKTDIENLTQSERDLLYALRDFVRFRKDFTVQVASAYYGVLGNRDAVRNSFLNFQSSRKAGDRTRDLAAEGRTTQTDLGRIEQQELSAETAWVNAIRTYQRALDDFKIQIGIAVEARIVLDDKELEQLKVHHPKINVNDAIRIALAARLDYQNVRDRQDDSSRKVALAADQLKPQLDFVANGALNSPVKSHGFTFPEIANYDWSVGANLDLPLERKAERNAYRSTLIAQEQARRNTDLQRDQIESQIRDSWRSLEQAKRNYEINEIGVKLAERRVEEQELLAEFGRAKALDQVDAQNALVSSKDQLTQALVTHTIARLQFWDNMGILYIKDDGQWEEMEETPRSAGTSSSREVSTASFRMNPEASAKARPNPSTN
jgi:outer membrane protein TolC